MALKTAILAISVLSAAQFMSVGIASAKYFGFTANQAASIGGLRTAPNSRGATTCDQSGPTGCDLDEFIYICEHGGGGASSEPGGGVTCDVRPN